VKHLPDILLSRDIFALPKEIFWLILNQIDNASLLSMFLVSKAWNEGLGARMIDKCVNAKFNLAFLQEKLPVRVVCYQY
jgi:hypothetical protein